MRAQTVVDTTAPATRIEPVFLDRHSSAYQGQNEAADALMVVIAENLASAESLHEHRIAHPGRRLSENLDHAERIGDPPPPIYAHLIAPSRPMRFQERHPSRVRKRNSCACRPPGRRCGG